MNLLVQWAITSSILILIVLAVRRLFRDRLSARLRYALWGVVLLRLLVPFQVELPAAASKSLPLLASNLVSDVDPWLDEAMLYALPTEVYPGNQSLTEGSTVIDRTLHSGSDSDRAYYSGGVVVDREHATHYFFMMPASELLTAIWGTGTALCLLVILYSNWGFFLRLGRSRKRLEGIDAPIPVYAAEGLSSPCLFGVLRPAVYVTPEAAENPDTLRHVLAHELTHYTHKDHIWSLLRILALALHWYNPLVWLAVWLSKGDGELACDEGAVRQLGEAERIPYGRTLVDMVAARSLRPGDLLSCSTAMTGGKKSIQQRVARLVKKPETVKTALFTVIALVALSAVFVFVGRGDNTPRNFQSFVDRATAIRYIPPTYSSKLYPSPITAPDLLAEAKEALSGVTTLNDGDPQPDLSPKALMHTSWVLLTFEGGEMEYSLLWQNDRTYLFPGNIYRQYLDLREEEGETAQLQGVSGTLISKPGVNLITTLERLANGSRTQQITGSGSPEFERFLADLDSAQSIFVGQPMISSAGPRPPITNPEALAQAKELLEKARPPFQAPEGATLEDLQNSIDTEPAPITQEDLEKMLFGGGSPVVLCPDEAYQFSEEHRYWLSNYKDGSASVLLQWYPEREENKIEVLATFSEDVYSQLAELARTNRAFTRSLALDRLLREAESASSIRYRPPSYSSYFYREDITDPDLLANVRESLSYLIPLEDTDSLPDGQATIHASRIILTTGEGEITYTLIPWKGYTYVTRGSGDYSVQEGGRTEFLRTRTKSSLPDTVSSLAGTISSLARTQELVSQDPYIPVAMTRAELGGYEPDFVREQGIRLQGRPGGEDGVTFSRGYRVRGSGAILLEYGGDETHAGGWMLELREKDWSVLSDQPSVLRLAPTIYGMPGSSWTYEIMEPTLFAAYWKPRDVVSVTAGDYNPGQKVEMDLPALKDQLTQALYHQFSDDYDKEKYGQYVVTIQVEGTGLKSYADRDIDENADRLILSAGSEQDAVCLRHKTFAQNTDASSAFVRSPELYRTIRDLFD